MRRSPGDAPGDAPPALPRRILATALPPGPVGASILGDLAEEWSRRPVGAGRELFYWREALRLAARYGTARLGSGVLALGADFRNALLRVFRSPAHAALTVLALGLGIGAPATMFSVVEGISRDVEVAEPERLVHVGRRRTSTLIRGADLAWLRPFLDGVEGLASLGLFRTQTVDLSGVGGTPERRNSGVVTPGFFRVLDARPVLGRTLRADDVASERRVVVLSWRLWQSRFGGDRTILGRTIRVDGTPHRVVGVMPESGPRSDLHGGLPFPGGVSLWTPLDPHDPAAADAGSYEMLGRLEEGATLETVQARVAAVTEALREAGHEIVPARGLAAQSLRHRLLGPDVRRMLNVMLLVASFVLLIACANVANLLLAQALDRSRETAVRMALGAGRARVVGGQLAEAAALAVVGGVLGLALAAGATATFERMLSGILAFWMEVRLDLPVLLFSAGLVGVAALATGLLPALRAGRVEVGPFLRDGGRGSSAFRIGRVSRALVVGEVALSCALLVVAGLMVQGAVTNLRTDGEYETSTILTARYELREDAHPDADAVLAFHRRVLERLEGRPGVADAALASHLPGTFSARRRVEIEGRTYDRPEDRPATHLAVVSPGFFETMGSGLLRGRPLSWDDGADAPAVAVVNEAFVRRHFPDRDPLGSAVRLRSLSGWDEERSVRANVVGVAPPLGIDVGRDDDGSGVYLPLSADPARRMALLVRTPEGRDPRGLIPGLRRAVADLDPHLALYDVGTLEGHLAETRVAESVFAVLFLAFGVAGLLLASVGLYGLLSFTVRRRVRELGVRIAVGAGPGPVLWVAIRGGALQLALGLALGLGLAALLAPLLGEALLGQDPRDPLVYAAVAGTLALTGMLAALSPARRALGVDVVEALRTE